jgi:hypothetical protein
MQIYQPAASVAKPSARGDWTTRVFATFIPVAAAIIIGGAAQAQQSVKSGKYTGKAAVNPAEGVEQIYELEKGHVFLLGLLKGVFFNDVADGFLDKTQVSCPRVLDIVGGVPVASHGYCIITDRNGDKAFLVWQGNGTADGRGTFKWTGGTGKYSGLQGNNTFQFTGIGKTGAGVSAWKGDWRLP